MSTVKRTTLGQRLRYALNCTYCEQSESISLGFAPFVVCSLLVAACFVTAGIFVWDQASTTPFRECAAESCAKNETSVFVTTHVKDKKVFGLLKVENCSAVVGQLLPCRTFVSKNQTHIHYDDSHFDDLHQRGIFYISIGLSIGAFYFAWFLYHVVRVAVAEIKRVERYLAMNKND